MAIPFFHSSPNSLPNQSLCPFCHGLSRRKLHHQIRVSVRLQRFSLQLRLPVFRFGQPNLPQAIEQNLIPEYCADFTPFFDRKLVDRIRRPHLNFRLPLEVCQKHLPALPAHNDDLPVAESEFYAAIDVHTVF
jgi:hypothetical protein